MAVQLLQEAWDAATVAHDFERVRALTSSAAWTEFHIGSFATYFNSEYASKCSAPSCMPLRHAMCMGDLALMRFVLEEGANPEDFDAQDGLSAMGFLVQQHYCSHSPEQLCAMWDLLHAHGGGLDSAVRTAASRDDVVTVGAVLFDRAGRTHLSPSREAALRAHVLQ